MPFYISSKRQTAAHLVHEQRRSGAVPAKADSTGPKANHGVAERYSGVTTVSGQRGFHFELQSIVAVVRTGQMPNGKILFSVTSWVNAGPTRSVLDAKAAGIAP